MLLCIASATRCGDAAVALYCPAERAVIQEKHRHCTAVQGAALRCAAWLGPCKVVCSHAGIAKRRQRLGMPRHAMAQFFDVTQFAVNGFRGKIRSRARK